MPAEPGIDLSWGVALHLAILEHLRWGHDIAFTYGPLGFLAVPVPYVGWTSALALLFCGAVYVATAATVLWSGAKQLPLWLAVAIAFAAGRLFFLIPPFETLTVLVFLWSLQLVRSGPTSHWRAIAIGGGVIVAIGALGKLNAGLVIAAMAGLASIRIVRPRWQGPSLLVGATLASSVVFWLATGQQLADLPIYASSSLEFLRGYSDAMALDVHQNTILAGGLLTVVAATLAVAASGGWRREPRLSQAIAGLIGLVFVFAFWKAAVVRADAHVSIAVAAAALVVVPLTAHVTNVRLRLALVGAVMVAVLPVARLSPFPFPNVPDSARSLVSEGVEALVPGNQTAAAEATQRDLRAGYALPDQIVAALAGHTVHVEWWETAVVLAYPQIRWRPLPTFQSYAAFTPSLDEMNAAELRATDGPERILRENFVVNGAPWSIDDRNRWFESPAAVLETFCRYVEVAATERWQVLARTDGHCRPPEHVSLVTATAGQPVTVPTESRPDRFTVVRITGMGSSPLARLKSLFWKGDQWFITLDSTPYRLVPATAADGLVIAVPPSIVAGPAFSFGDAPRTVAVTSADKSGSDGLLTYEFTSVPWEPDGTPTAVASCAPAHRTATVTPMPTLPCPADDRR